MEWPTEMQISRIILESELPDADLMRRPAWERAADAILALFEPLRARIEEADEIERVSLDYARQWRAAIGAEHLPLDEPLLIGLAKSMRAELEALRPVARAAAHWADFNGASQNISDALNALDPARRARLLEGA